MILTLSSDLLYQEYLALPCDSAQVRYFLELRQRIRNLARVTAMQALSLRACNDLCCESFGLNFSYCELVMSEA